MAVLLQRKELEYQRAELSATRSELRGQREALEAQILAADRQRFESTFFEMLRLHNEIVGAIVLPRFSDGLSEFFKIGERRPPRELAHGRSAFGNPLKRALMDVLAENAEESRAGVESTREQIEASAKLIRLAYLEFYQMYQADLGHYFRFLYNILKYVDASDRDDVDKQLYSNLLRAQLSVDELVLLAYNCFGPGREKFKPLVEKYDLLQNLESSSLLYPSHFKLLTLIDSAGEARRAQS